MLPPGTLLAGRYQLVAELGRGGAGVVYQATDALLERRVAIKVLGGGLRSEARERFQREARAVAQMDHPGIVEIFDVGEHDSALFLVMPFVAGTTLRSRLEEDALPLDQALALGVELAEALEHAHARGVIHRDVKPENVLLSIAENGEPRPRLTDFGLALVQDQGRMTQSGALMGTIQYLSPEQIATAPVDRRCDLYSLATVLYECLAGRTPFTGSPQQVLYAIAHEPAPPLRRFRPEVSEELEALLQRCLAKDPEQRPASSAELALALAACRRDLAPVPEAPAPRRVRVTPERGLVGRGRELAQLQEALRAALAEECRLVLIGGEPGIGKSRLLAELAREAAGRGALVLRGRFVEQDRSLPYQGFCDAMLEFFRLRSRSAPEVDLSDLAGDLLALFPVLGEVAEVRNQARAGEQGRWVPGGQGGDRTVVFELLARTFARLAGGRALTLLLEDLHGGDVSVEALQYMVRRLGPTPLLVAGTYRSSEAQRGHPLQRLIASFENDPRLVHLLLAPLSPGEVRQLLGLASGGTVDEPMAQRLYEAAEGNPYFTLELFRSLRESDGGGPSGAHSRGALLGTDTLPPTIQQTIERRLQRLPESALNVLGAAAVVGRAVELRDLRLLVPDGNELDEAIDTLLEGRFLEEERRSRGDRLAFTSAVLREVVYAALPRRRRRALHRRYADALEELHAGRLERYYPQLALHYAEGEVPDQGVRYGLLAARRSLAAFAPEDATVAVRRVLDLLADETALDPSPEAEARLLLARAARLSGAGDVALRELERAVALWERADRPLDTLNAVLEAAQAAWDGRRVEEARRWAERGVSLGRTLGEPEALARCLGLAATLANLRGEQAVAQQYLEEADRLRRTPTLERAGGARGGVLAVAMPVALSARHPVEVLLDQEVELLANVFETLIAGDEQGNPVPYLVERWEIGDQGRTFLLPLRRDARFSNGQRLGAREVKTAFEAAIRRGHQALPPGFAAIAGATACAAGEAPDVSGLQVVDEETLRISLLEPLAIYPALLSDHATAVALPHPAAPTGLVGSGPFCIASWQGERVRLERDPEHWRGEPPLLDGIEVHTAVPASRMAAGLRTGAFDLVRDLLPEDLDELLRDRVLQARSVEVTRKNVYFVLFSQHSARLAQPRRRQGLALAARPHDLVRRALGRLAQPAEGFFPPGILGHDPGRRPDPGLPHHQLQQLLAVGEPPLRLRAAIHPLLQDRFQGLTRDLLGRWSELGVEVETATPTLEEFFGAAHHPATFDLMVGRYVADYDDPDTFVRGLFDSRFGRWRRFCSSPQLDTLIEAARLETHPAARARLYGEVERLLLDQHRLVPLFHEVDFRVAGPRVRNLRLRSDPPYVNYAELACHEEATPVAAGAVEGGGFLEVPIGEALDSLDPALVWREAQVETVPNVFETLTRAEQGARVVPWLAAEYLPEDGGRRYRFRLRDGVRFHDGRPVTARDVRYSFERLLQQAESRARWQLAPIRGAGALLRGEAGDLAGFLILSRTDFLIELDRPLSFFPALLSYTSAAIVPEGAERFAHRWRDGCLGTGPFRVAAFEPGRRLELEPNPFYWRAGLPRSEGLTFALDVDPQAAAEGFRAGRFHVLRDPAPAVTATLQEGRGGQTQRAEAPRLCTYLALCNVHRPALADLAVRRRLLATIAVEELVHEHLARLAVPARRIIPPGLLGHDPLPPRAARGTSSGGGIELAVMLHGAYPERYSGFTEALLARWRQAGFRLRLLEGPFEHAEGAWAREHVDLGLFRWFGDYPDPDTFIHGLLHSAEGQQGALCGGADLDALIDEARVEPDPRMRGRLYRRIEDLVAEQALCLPLFHENTYCYAPPTLQGLSVGLGAPSIPYEQIWLRR